MTQEKEHILFEDIRNGNEKAFNKALDLYYSRLCFFADGILHDQGWRLYDYPAHIMQNDVSPARALKFIELCMKDGTEK